MALRKKTAAKTVKKTLRISKRKTKSVKAGSKGEAVVLYLLFGALFGFFLSKSRATDYDSIVDMFMFKDFQLYGVIGTAILVVAVGLFFFQRFGILTLSKKPLDWEPLKFEPSRLWGALLFGAGWALAGTCPGTSIAQLGEGKIMAIFTVAGIFGGVWAYKKFMPGAAKEMVC